MTHKQIDAKLLVQHPGRVNHGDAAVLQKLRRHIERTGLYEPLTVRLHPHEEGKFQIINGHSRYWVLRALGHKKIACTVWEIDDLGTDLCVATLNALSGNEVPERRAVLVGQLAMHFEDEELMLFLPDKRKKLEALMRLARVELNNPQFREANKTGLEDSVVVSFKLDKADTQPVELALGLLENSTGGRIPPGKALVELAQFFLENHNRETLKTEPRKAVKA